MLTSTYGPVKSAMADLEVCSTVAPGFHGVLNACYATNGKSSDAHRERHKGELHTIEDSQGTKQTLDEVSPTPQERFTYKK